MTHLENLTVKQLKAKWTVICKNKKAANMHKLEAGLIITNKGLPCNPGGDAPCHLPEVLISRRMSELTGPSICNLSMNEPLIFLRKPFIEEASKKPF
jgi:hypothetical protein